MLDKTKLRETDLIFTLLAENGMQVRAVGKGARKPGSRLAARCELGCTVDALFARGRSLDVISEATLVHAPLGASPSYELLSSVSALVDIARFCCFEDAEDPFVFAITARALEVLGGGAPVHEEPSSKARAAAVLHEVRGDDDRYGLAGARGDGSTTVAVRDEGRPVPLDSAHLDLVLAAYIFKLLAHLGYLPDFSSCVACGDSAVTYFSGSAGGLLCASCASSIPGAEEVDRTTVDWLRSLMALRFDQLAAVPCDSATATFLLVLAHGWAATHLDARLRALEFLLGC